LFQYTAIDCCTRVRLVQFSEELTAQTSAAFAQYVLTTFPFPVRCVQTDNDPTFTHWDHRGAQDAGGSPREAPPFTRMCQQFGALHRLLPPRTPR
jgi:hypothetical protein